MTLTETHPAPVTGEPAEDLLPAAVLPESPFTTSDHKRIGRYYIAAALLFVLVSTVIAVILEISLTGTGASTLEYDRLFSLHSTSAAVLFLPLLFVGLATYLVPLQVGARRLAFPRVQALAFWGTLFGGVLLLCSYLFGKPNGWGIAYPTALPFAQGGASRATDLWVASLVLITVCMALAGANLLVTVVKLRAPGMTMARVPVFTWSVLAVSAGIVLAAPIFAAGLLVLYLDQHFGAGVFKNAHGDVVWQHSLWLYGRPDVYLVVVPALGALTDVVATHARRPLPSAVAAKGLVFCALVLSFGILAADRTVEQAVLQPTPTVLTALIAVPIALLVLMWLGTIRPAALHLHISLAYVFGFVALLVAGGVNALIAPSQHVQVGSAWTVGQVHAVLFGAPTLAAFAALYHWAPKIYGVAFNALLGALQLLCLLAGFITMAAGQWIAGYDGAPWHVGTYTGADASNWANYAKVSSAGGLLVALGLLLFCGNAAISWARARTLPESRRPANPYEAATLEWGTSSPPPEDNFDSIPEVRSAAPLAPLAAPLAPSAQEAAE